MFVTRLLQSYITTHLFESGVLEHGNISNMQGRAVNSNESWDFLGHWDYMGHKLLSRGSALDENRGKMQKFPPGLEPGTFRVLSERDNRYTTETANS